MTGRNPIPGSMRCPHAQTGGCSGHRGHNAGSGPHHQEWYDCEDCASDAFSNMADNASVLLVLGAAGAMVAGTALTIAWGMWELVKEIRRVIR